MANAEKVGKVIKTVVTVADKALHLAGTAYQGAQHLSRLAHGAQTVHTLITEGPASQHDYDRIKHPIVVAHEASKVVADVVRAGQFVGENLPGRKTE